MKWLSLDSNSASRHDSGKRLGWRENLTEIRVVSHNQICSNALTFQVTSGRCSDGPSKSVDCLPMSPCVPISRGLSPEVLIAS